MRNVKYLSNEELVDELVEINKVGLFTYYSEKVERIKELKEEILKRLNEPWRKIKEKL